MNTATITGTARWPDGSNMNGYVAICLVLPGQNGTTPVWPRLTTSAGYPSIAVPIWQKVPIKDGVINGTVWQNSALHPPGSQYAARYYDSTGVLVGGDPQTFTANTSSVTLTPDISITPTTGTTIPTPAEVI